jgi:hypothetical protein
MPLVTYLCVFSCLAFLRLFASNYLRHTVRGRRSVELESNGPGTADLELFSRSQRTSPCLWRSVPKAPGQRVYDMLCSDRRVAAAAGMFATGTPMVAMHEERVYVTERQKQQLKRTTGSLRQLNRTVLRELRRIGRPNQTTKRYSDAGVLLETAASQISSLLRFREETLTSARDEPRVLFVTISVIGRGC